MRSQIEGASQHLVEQLIKMLTREVSEQMQKESHTTAFVAWNNKVCTVPFPPSTHGFSGFDLHNPPKISTFCGLRSSMRE